VFENYICVGTVYHRIGMLVNRIKQVGIIITKNVLTLLMAIAVVS